MMRGIILLCASALLAAAASDACRAAADDDAAALALTSPETAVAGPRSATLVVEAAGTAAERRSGGRADEQRVSFDFRLDQAVAANFRAIIADHLDLDWLGSAGGAQQINTLKQAYVSWQPQSELVVDAGRINGRQGVALGYNPTDYFRTNAVRNIVSLDPNTVRDERLGTVMLRGEKLWNGGALTAEFAPQLVRDPGLLPPSAGPFSADFAATNGASRWLVSLSQRLIGTISPQLLLFGAEGHSPQVGINVTSLFGTATVTFLEASAGRAPTALVQAQGLPDTDATRTRVATGLTYSANNKLSVTLEYEYDGAAPGRAAWFAAQTSNPAAYVRYRNISLAQQDLTTRQALFGYAAWPDFIVRHLDLTAFVRVDLIDHSRLPWTELRYRWSHVDAALRWQNFQGSATSDFGASSTGQTWQVLLDYYW